MDIPKIPQNIIGPFIMIIIGLVMFFLSTQPKLFFQDTWAYLTNLLLATGFFLIGIGVDGLYRRDSENQLRKDNGISDGICQNCGREIEFKKKFCSQACYKLYNTKDKGRRAWKSRAKDFSYGVIVSIVAAIIFTIVATALADYQANLIGPSVSIDFLSSTSEYAGNPGIFFLIDNNGGVPLHEISGVLSTKCEGTTGKYFGTGELKPLVKNLKPGDSTTMFYYDENLATAAQETKEKCVGAVYVKPIFKDFNGTQSLTEVYLYKYFPFTTQVKKEVFSPDANIKVSLCQDCAFLFSLYSAEKDWNFEENVFPTITEYTISFGNYTRLKKTDVVSLNGWYISFPEHFSEVIEAKANEICSLMSKIDSNITCNPTEHSFRCIVTSKSDFNLTVEPNQGGPC